MRRGNRDNAKESMIFMDDAVRVVKWDGVVTPVSVMGTSGEVGCGCRRWWEY